MLLESTAGVIVLLNPAEIDPEQENDFRSDLI
jgi:hypothetical protein